MKMLLQGLGVLAFVQLMHCQSNEDSPVGRQKPEKPVQGDNPYAKVDLTPLMVGIEGTFVLYDKLRDRYVRYNEMRAADRFSPCSTFKIPNTLIGLETGAAKSAYMTIKWDQEKHPKQSFWDDLKRIAGVDWARDHTLKSAFRNSVVWYYK